ncbi:hypothetical protein QTP70_009038 [Hemibagrus guttatus]|uniref:Reverse transcriptase RNase H-like domain-containing protein n=1 Tax=Hemibagrus guttatus TaxID=175788 RepID=A0AAE0R0K4_9TELE|nr:hypothetical protein QTP70_009038 [Hemibagrus guttatus]
MAPILRYPDPDLPIVVEAELEELQHWLEGAHHPFLVLTDHRNLEYLCSAKWLNPRQAWWALFFTRFEFSVTYCPGTKNSKADALSRQFKAQSEPSQPELILPAAAILAPVRWSIIEEIQQAHADEPPPVNSPSTKVYVPLQFPQLLLQWVHEAPSSAHPGILRSTQLTLRRFWRPFLRTDVERQRKIVAEVSTQSVIFEELLKLYAKEALCELYGAISDLQNAQPNELFIIAGDFNHGNLKTVLPKFHQHVDIATRGAKTLDLVYTNIPGTYRLEPHPHLSYSDNISMLIPAYRPLVRCSKLVLKHVKTWPAGATSALQDCFECTDWNMFRKAATNSINLEKYTTSVTSYIGKCIDDVAVAKTITTRSNQKPWMTA